MLYNYSYNIAALIILSLVLIVTFTNYVTKSKELKLYRALIISVILCCFLDVLTSFTISYYTYVPRVVNLILNTFYFFTSVFPLLFVALYVLQTIENKNKLFFFSCIFPIILYNIILVVNIFTGILFSFDENGVYTHGPVFLLNYLFPFIYIIIIAYSIMKYRKTLKVKQIISLLIFIFFFGIAAIMQAFIFPNVLLIFFAASIAVASFLFSIETPDYKELEYLRHNLELEVERKTKQVNDMSIQAIEAFALTIDAKDEYTKGHSLRVAGYSKMIAKELGLDDLEVEEIYNSALLHDVGKIGIPDSILKKTERLTDEEFAVIKRHTIIGHEILSKMERFNKSSEAAYHHHERYDGRGYPEGLKGEEISLMSRIVAIADAFDAMNSNRVYRKALTKEIIKGEFIKNSGKQFDPNIVPTFLKIWDEGKLEEISKL